MRVKPGTSVRHQFVFGSQNFVKTPDYKPPPFQFVTAKDYRDARLSNLPGSSTRSKRSRQSRAGTPNSRPSSKDGSTASYPEPQRSKLRPIWVGKPPPQPPKSALDQLEAEDAAEAEALEDDVPDSPATTSTAASNTAKSRRERFRSGGPMNTTEALRRLNTTFGQAKQARLKKLQLLVRSRLQHVWLCTGRVLGMFI